jgi:hydrogenase-4 transcriptional activator
LKKGGAMIEHVNPAPEGVSRRHLPVLLANVRSSLSWLIAGLKNGSEDESTAEMCRDLEKVSEQLDAFIEKHSLDPVSVVHVRASVLVGRETKIWNDHQFTYCSDAMHLLMRQIERAAKHDVPILIKGETGVGKELVARFIHLSSQRAHRPFVPVNCPAIPRELFENHLFGHRQGAFTGAVRDYLGLVRSAAGGTLLLDEIGELPLELQPKLLRFLQEGEVHTVGETVASRVDVRVLASTNRDLDIEVKAGRFRADLLHRLNVVSFEIPPLRGRREDIPLLIEFFVNSYAQIPGNFRVHFTPQALDCLRNYSWPGNVRELSSMVMQNISTAEEDALVSKSDLPPHIACWREGDQEPNDVGKECIAGDLPSPFMESTDLPLAEVVMQLERRRVQEALVRNNWSYTRAARQLGLSTFGLRKKYRRLFAEDLHVESGAE